MANQDTSGIKEKIIYILKTKGPSLPVHIAKETGLSILFASAFLSELLSEKKIKISNMRVGSSPIYFIKEQENNLEKYASYLKSKERESFILLKEKKFLKDKKQEPAIRVALRAIKDFAIPFQKNEELYWRYFKIPEEEFLGKQEIKEKEDILEKQPEIKKKEDIFEKKPIKKLIKKTNKTQKDNKNDKFFNKIKEFLSKKSIEILDIENFSKESIIFKIKKNDKEKILIAYNKKRINESDLIKANKKAEELNLQYIILSLGEPLKKLNNLINAIKNLSEIEKIE